MAWFPRLAMRQRETTPNRFGCSGEALEAVRPVAVMERALARMEAHYAKARECLAEVPVDGGLERAATYTQMVSDSLGFAVAKISDAERRPIAWSSACKSADG